MMERILLSLVFAGLAAAQEGADKLKVAFRDPSRPGTLKIHLVHGGITVRGYNGQEVLIESTPRRRDDDDRPKGDATGLRRLYAPSNNITVEEENNVMRIEVSPQGRASDMVVQVPMKTSLNLQVVNGGNLVVENVQGDIEVNNTNGNVNLNNVAGSVVAHALNGNLMATIREVAAGKPISFSSLNGKIDVTLPASLKANLNLQSANGNIFSDYEIVLSQTAPTVEETKREEGRGRYRISTSKGMVGKVNGGGQDVTFKNMNGNIYIRKGK